MSISVFLNFSGNCREAAEFYGKVFDSVPRILTFADAPEEPAFPLTEEARELVMHAQVEACGGIIMLSDVLPGTELLPGNNFTLSLQDGNKAMLTTWFERLSEGGKVIMPLAETFWSPLYGNLIDRFGIGWQVNLPH